jgi:hypothetical protein
MIVAVVSAVRMAVMIVGNHRQGRGVVNSNTRLNVLVRVVVMIVTATGVVNVLMKFVVMMFVVMVMAALSAVDVFMFMFMMMFVRKIVGVSVHRGFLAGGLP